MADDSVILVKYAAFLGDSHTFRKRIFSSRIHGPRTRRMDIEPLKIKATNSSETTRLTSRKTRCHF
jgi:hypothetical protein